MLSRLRPGAAFLALLMAAASTAMAGAASLPAPKAARAQALYGRIPLSFEPNVGQISQTGRAAQSVKFLAHAPRYTLFLTRDATVLSPSACASQNQRSSCWVKMQLLGANASVTVRALHPLPGVSNYFIGNDPRAWRTGVAHFGRVSFKGVYQGINLAYYGNPRHLEYDFEVSPYADASLIQLKLQGAAGPLAARIGANGDLNIAAPGGFLVLLKPAAYQIIGGKKQPVASGYAIEDNGRVRFDVGPYDHSKKLIIDPALVYSTYLGGGGGDSISGIAVDGSGDAFVTGGTGSTNFPTASPEQKSLTGASNAFISELKPDGSGLVFSTYVGGTGYDKGTGIALDPSGNIYVAGYTSSANFPTTSGVLQKTFQGAPGKSEAFVLKLNSGGAALSYATYLGGSNGDFAYGIAVDSGGNAYVTGSTQSSNFPTANPIQKSLNGGSDAFVAKLNPQGASLVYSTFLGGSSADSGQAIAIDSAGEAFVTGFTLSTDFPTVTPLQSSGGAGDAFVTKVNSTGSALLYSTYLGGSAEDRGLAIAVDGAGDAFVAGVTQSADFPTTPGAYQTTPGGASDAFVTEINPAGSQKLYSTLLGGSGADQANGVALDPAGNAYVAGSTASSNFPTVTPSQSSLGGGACATTCSNAFVSVIKSGGAGLVYSTYLGGSGPDYGTAVAADSSGNAYVAGTTTSNNFPATGGVFQGTYSGSGSSGNGFIAKVSPANTPALSLNPQTLSFGNQALATASSPLTVTLTNVGSAPMTLSGFSTSDSEFAVSSNTCNGALAAGGAQCTVSVTFTPGSTASTTTAITANLQITDSAAGSPQSVALTGTGATPGPGITFSPSPLNFPGAPLVGSSSGPLPVTLTNTGSAPLTISAVAISGSYSQTSNCVATIQPGSSCTIQVTFSPTTTTGATGSSSSSSSSSTADNIGAISVTSNFSGTAPTDTVNGNATADFTLNSTGPSGTTLVSATSVNLTVGAVATLSSFTKSITLSCSGEVTCSFNPTSITPGQTSTMTVSNLTASSSGVPNPNPVTFTVTGTSSDSNQAATLAESIPLQSFSMSAAPAVTNIVAGQATTYTVTVSSVNGFNLPVALGCSSGLPANASCSFSPATVTPAPGAPQSSTVTITTTKHTGSSRMAPISGERTLPPGTGKIALWILLLISLAAVILAISLRGKRGRRLAWAMFGLILLSVALLAAGCNQGYYGFVGSNPAPTGSPSGVYTVVITGTYTPASGVTGQAVTTGSTSVNLAVQ